MYGQRRKVTESIWWRRWGFLWVWNLGTFSCLIFVIFFVYFLWYIMNCNGLLHEIVFSNNVKICVSLFYSEFVDAFLKNFFTFLESKFPTKTYAHSWLIGSSTVSINTSSCHLVRGGSVPSLRRDLCAIHSFWWEISKGFNRVHKVLVWMCFF